MSNHKLILQDVTKFFGRRLIFQNINKEFFSGNIYGFAGNNGTGKSTLAKITAGLLSPNKGKVEHYKQQQPIDYNELYNLIGFVSPELILYDEFTAEENVLFALQIRGIKPDGKKIDFLFEKFNLFGRRKDTLKKYSSGMKQRVKFIIALIHNPTLLILDEPTSNLDNKGKEIVYKIIESEAKEKLIIIASNEKNDLLLCNNILQLENYKQ